MIYARESYQNRVLETYKEHMISIIYAMMRVFQLVGQLIFFRLTMGSGIVMEVLLKKHRPKQPNAISAAEIYGG